MESPVKMFPEKPIQRHPQIDQVGESLDVRLCQVSEKNGGDPEIIQVYPNHGWSFRKPSRSSREVTMLDLPYEHYPRLWENMDECGMNVGWMWDEYGWIRVNVGK